MAKRLTPVMKQHAAAKSAHPDCVVFFRLGDFYEMFGEDAVLCARELDLTLTSRNKGKKDEIPMAGVPHHAAHGYIARLLERGHKVAVCEQMADPSTVKGIVPRQVVRVITAGTVIEDDQLETRQNSWLVAVEMGAVEIGIALFDFSTSELRATTLTDRSMLLAELAHAMPREILIGGLPEDGEQPLVASIERLCVGAALRWDEPLAAAKAQEVLGALASDSQVLGVEGSKAAARALRYAGRCNPNREIRARRIARYSPADHMALDAVAQDHLELLRSAAGKEATLLYVVDQTRTPAGARLLRRRLAAPLLRLPEIRRRLDRVELFLLQARLRKEFCEALRGVGDLERLATRVSLNAASPRDLGALRDGLARGGQAVELLHAATDRDMLEVLDLCKTSDVVSDVAAELKRALLDVPGAKLKEGALFSESFDPKLAELSELRRSGTEQIVAYEARLREETGINTLKVRYTRVFGWYVEVGRTHSARVPSDWHRKQTVANGERFTTRELDELADRIESADSDQRQREDELLHELIALVASAAPRIHAFTALLARLDVSAALAEVAHRFDYCRPVVNEDSIIDIKDGRHPVVERMAASNRFVPNDVHLDSAAARLWLVTGPNMAGKSTLLRQVALTAILAQIGSYVPAAAATIGLVDRVLSRVGASDNLSAGESTFMVEMRETASILRTATSRSLVILDEIGRGTSTFDGLAIAWAVSEYLAEAVGCRTLFATHYYELTKLAESSEHVANYSVSAKELDDSIVFLHRLVQGAASQSYGVQVAKLAGLPEVVLARARELLSRFEEGSAPSFGVQRLAERTQLDLFQDPRAKEASEVAHFLRELDVDRVTGIEALNLLSRLKSKLE